MLKSYITIRDDGLSSSELISKYYSELEELCKYDKDTKDSFGFVNTWWVFGEVASKSDYSIFMAEADNVGYKRTKRGEKQMPNELFRTDSNGRILIDDGVNDTILDYMRALHWD